MKYDEFKGTWTDGTGTTWTKKQAHEACEMFTTAITGALMRGDTVSIPGFGKFEVQELAARKGVNPRTQEPMMIPAQKIVKFRPAAALRSLVKQP